MDIVITADCLLWKAPDKGRSSFHHDLGCEYTFWGTPCGKCVGDCTKVERFRRGDQNSPRDCIANCQYVSSWSRIHKTYASNPCPPHQIVIFSFLSFTCILFGVFSGQSLIIFNKGERGSTFGFWMAWILQGNTDTCLCPLCIGSDYSS